MHKQTRKRKENKKNKKTQTRRKDKRKKEGRQKQRNKIVHKETNETYQRDKKEGAIKGLTAYSRAPTLLLLLLGLGDETRSALDSMMTSYTSTALFRHDCALKCSTLKCVINVLPNF